MAISGTILSTKCFQYSCLLSSLSLSLSLFLSLSLSLSLSHSLPTMVSMGECWLDRHPDRSGKKIRPYFFLREFFPLPQGDICYRYSAHCLKGICSLGNKTPTWTSSWKHCNRPSFSSLISAARALDDDNYIHFRAIKLYLTATFGFR
jgi:hypothetical protein